MPVWSPQQDAALKAVRDWLRNPGRKAWFYLAGYAGTGKTTLAMHLAEGVDGDVVFGAYTGKAALVMQHKGCHGAATLHSLIYKLEEEGWGGEPKFVLNPVSPVRGARLVVVDEVSMVSDDLAADLLSFGVPILVLGDPAQLPPVHGEGFFTKREPDFMLTEVHRQALDNPIIAMSMDVREGRRLQYGTYGESRVIPASKIETDDVLAADQLLVGKNLTRHRYNQRMRHLRGFEGDLPNKGERLVCLRNNRQNGLLNGQTWEVEKAEFETFGRGPRAHVSDTDVTLAITDEMTRRQVETKARIEDFQGRDIELPWQALREFDRFDFGYALTVHKAQGSQWDNVFLFDESDTFREDRSRWLYTGLTRAAERVTVVM